MAVDDTGDSDLESMSIEEMEAERKRLKNEIAESDRRIAILKTALAWEKKRESRG